MDWRTALRAGGQRGLARWSVVAARWVATVGCLVLVVTVLLAASPWDERTVARTTGAVECDAMGRAPQHPVLFDDPHLQAASFQSTGTRVGEFLGAPLDLIPLPPPSPDEPSALSSPYAEPGLNVGEPEWDAGMIAPAPPSYTAGASTASSWVAPSPTLPEPGPESSEFVAADPADFCGSASCLPCESICCNWDVQAAFLFLAARNVDVPYAASVFGGAPNGPVGIVEPSSAGGFQVRGARRLDDCRWLELSFTNYSQPYSNSLGRTGVATGVRSTTFGPAITNTALDFVRADANAQVDVNTYALDARKVLFEDECTRVARRIGLAYAELDQLLSLTYTAPASVDTVVTGVDFEGIGMRLGWDAERFTSCDGGFLVYGSAVFTLFAGESRSSYRYQNNSNAETINAASRDTRLLPELDLEAGAGWESANGRLRLLAGYQYSGWYNASRPVDAIRSVQAGQLSDLSSTVSFDGLVARLVWGF